MGTSERSKATSDNRPREDIDYFINGDVDCDVCGQNPTVAETGLCGPCCFGEAETAGGNW